MDARHFIPYYRVLPRIIWLYGPIVNVVIWSKEMEKQSGGKKTKVKEKERKREHAF